MIDKRKTLCLDFDGVLHSYDSGWQGATAIPDPPVYGAAEFLEAAAEHFDICVYSSRSGQEGGIPAMKEWMCQEFGGEFVNQHISFPTSKPPAFVTIDDRVVRFTGAWPHVEDLLEFKPWNKMSPFARYELEESKGDDTGYTHFERLLAMSTDKSESWDLTDNDRRAIQWAIAKLDVPPEWKE